MVGGDVAASLASRPGRRDPPSHADAEAALVVVAALTRILAASAPVEEAARRALDAVCDRLGWAAGAVWLQMPGDDALSCIATAAVDARAEAYVDTRRQLRLGRGVELPGRAWAASQPLEIHGLPDDANVRRARLHSALAQPIMDGARCVGVLELFRGSELPRGAAGAVDVPSLVCAQLGQFVGRERARRDLDRLEIEYERFASTAAHDLAAPLHIMAGYVDLLRKHFAGKLDEDAEMYFGALLRNGERMRARIEALSAFAHVDESASLARQPVDCRLVAEEAVSALADLIDATGAVVTIGPLPTVHADRAQLAQVLENLLSNALQFHDGSAPKVHVSAARVPGGWCLAVADNGIGIEPADAERVFQPLTRARTRRRYEGSGMGLATCRRIVERHGGTIWLESTPGQGSTFRFTVPDGSSGA